MRQRLPQEIRYGSAWLNRYGIYYISCINCLTGNLKSGKISTVIALQKPVRPATGGEPAGSPLFFKGDIENAKDFFEL